MNFAVLDRGSANIELSDACGINNPDGKPRKRRSAPRAVLQGEFPWRAWVYKKNSRTPLCAASFVQEDTMALLTLASCVQGLSAEGLEVAFVKGGQRAAVGKVTVHSGYKAGQDTNNIAILKLRSLESTPAWASPACLPLAPPSHAAPCITTSDKDIRLNTIIPLRTVCTEAHEAPPDSLICAVAPPKDYQPAKAAGLFCKEQHVTTPLYILHGLAISRQDDSVTTYVNVWHFTDWIKNQLGIAH
ncbi:transmembrane protease serine 11D-like [Cydia strobilella]|uniref:transmembrane protease serine 11D-like n=1 Tax=Cydia strobilella TaxID=1100964 RepID=UPI0030046B92